jgi:glycosyltransferase involved in cell wall biosynthesis
MTDQPPAETGRDTEIVLFMRILHGRLAGGGRAVLERASLYAGLGRRVTVVVIGRENVSGVGKLRRTGQLHRAVRLVYFWRDAPRWSDHVAAARHVPLALPLPSGPGVTVDRVKLPKARGRHVYYVDGSPRVQLDLERGEVSACTVLDESGMSVERWYCDTEGRPAIIDRLGPDHSVPVHRTFVVDGRYRWLEVDLERSEGRGLAWQPGRRDESTTTFAQVVAAWLDRELAGRRRVVVFADGENVSQHVLRAMRHPGVRGVSVLHNSHTDHPHTADAPTKENWAAFLDDDSNVDLVVCLTSRQREHLAARYPGMPLAVVHHSVPPADPVDVRPDPHTAVFVGRLAPQKRLAHLVEAVRLVVEEVPHARLHVYGSGDEQPQLEAQIAAAGLGDNVRLLGFTEDPQRAFASAAVAVMTSLYEGLPLTLTEGMAVGTPFVAYDIDYGPAEVIRDGVDGVLVPPGDVRGMAHAIVRIMADPRHAARLRQGAAEVVERFSQERYAQAWIDVLARVGGERPDPGARPPAPAVVDVRDAVVDVRGDTDATVRVRA